MEDLETERKLPNLKGCTLLCQAIIANALEEHETDFFDSQFGDLCKTLAVIGNEYNLNKIIKNALNSTPITKPSYDSNQLYHDALSMSIEDMAKKYRTSEHRLKIALSKRHIPWQGKRVIQKTVNNTYVPQPKWVQLEFDFGC